MTCIRNNTERRSRPGMPEEVLFWIWQLGSEERRGEGTTTVLMLVSCSWNRSQDCRERLGGWGRGGGGGW